MTHTDWGQLRTLLGERQQRIAFRAAGTTPRLLAEEEDHECEYKRETDGEGKGNDIHGGTGLVFGVCAGAGRCGNFNGAATRLRVAALAVTKHFFGPQPVLEIGPFRTAILNPEEICRVLNFCFSGFAMHSGSFAFHVSIVVCAELKAGGRIELRRRCRVLRISCEEAQAANGSAERAFVAGPVPWR